MNGLSDSQVSAAAAKVAGHRVVDVVVRRFRIAREQRSRVHDLAGLAVTALRHVFLNPGVLERVQSFRTQPFDRGDGFSGN